MTSRRTAEAYCRLYYGFATPSFTDAVRNDPALRSVLKRWGRESSILDNKGEFDRLFQFAETEFYERAKEIAAVASTLCEVPPLRFNYMRVASYQAFASLFEGGEPLIFVDADYIDVLVAFFAGRVFEIYHSRSQDERLTLNRHSASVLRCFVSGQRMDGKLRDDAEEFFGRDEHSFGVAVSLCRTAMYFIIAHEIAHASLGHSNTDDVWATELEADALGARIYARLAAERGLRWASVPDGYMGSPLLFLEFLNSVERHAMGLWAPGRTGGGYPPARLRRNRIAPALTRCSESDHGLYLDLRHSISRMNVALRRGAALSNG